MERVRIEIIPEGLPSVIRNCAKCGVKQPFLPSDQFRINAQKKLLDIWLIYRCTRCGATWNMALFSRVTPRSLARELYDQLLANDADLIRQCAFDLQMHRRAESTPQYDALEYRIKGIPEEWPQECEVTIHCPVSLGVRVGKLLREILCLSGAEYARRVGSGDLSSPDGVNLAKARMGCELRVLLRHD